MLASQNLISLEFNPDTGQMEPISPEQMHEETQGWTTPPEGLPSRWHGLWRVARRKALNAGNAPDKAWFAACRAVSVAEATFLDKARKRFFRP